MKFGEFMVQLKKGVPHVLLLAGEERYYIDRALEAVLAQLFPDGGQQDSLTKLTGDVDSDQLVGLLETVPFLIPKNVVIVEDTTLFRAAKKSTEKEEAEEAEIAQEFIIDNVVFSPIRPQKISPDRINLVDDALRRLLVDLAQAAFQFRLEMLEIRQRFAARIHLDVELIRQPHLPNRQEVERDGIPLQLRPEIRHICEAFLDRVQHDEHGGDRRVFFP